MNKKKSRPAQFIDSPETAKQMASLVQHPLQHGAIAIERIGFRPCRPRHCPVKSGCPQADLEASERPDACQHARGTFSAL